MADLHRRELSHSLLQQGDVLSVLGMDHFGGGDGIREYVVEQLYVHRTAGNYHTAPAGRPLLG